MHTIYVPKKLPSKKGSDSSLNLDSDPEEESKDEDDDELGDDGQHADIVIIMEKADKTLQQVIFKRKSAGKPFEPGEIVKFWGAIISVFAFCTVFNVSHNDIKPSNILLVH